MTLLVPDAPTLFLNARLIDGDGGKPVKNAAVLVEGTQDHEGRQDGRLRREPERQHAGDRPRAARRSCPA